MMDKTAYLMIRLAIGVSMFGHGFIRLFHLKEFAGHVIGSFEKSMLPASLVSTFGYILPFVEFLIGLFLIIGLFTRQAAVAGCVVMLVLLFGSSMVQNWGVFTSQMMHVLFFVLVIQFISGNSYALDRLRKR